MSYQSLLDDIKGNVIIGPYMAIGLKKPGEERGVWLFGESHEDGKREQENIAGDLYIGDVIAKYADNAILLFEGEDAGFGAGLFADAPPVIKSMVSRQTENEYYLEELTTPSSAQDIELDSEGYNILPADEDTLEMWQDDFFWDEVLHDASDIPFIAERFRSKGGIGVNIERPIRKYIFNGLHMADIHGQLDLHGYMSSVTWALNKITSSPLELVDTDSEVDVSSLPLRAIGYINAYRKYIEHKFPRTVDDGMKKSMVSTLAEMLQPDQDNPLFLNNGLHSDDNRYLFIIALLIDLNVTEKIEFHSDKDIVVYCGAKHSISQMVLLLKQGYVVEHLYLNTSPNEDVSFHRLSPTHEKDAEFFSYDTSVDIVRNILNTESILGRIGADSSCLIFN